MDDRQDKLSRDRRSLARLQRWSVVPNALAAVLISILVIHDLTPWGLYFNLTLGCAIVSLVLVTYLTVKIRNLKARLER